MSGVLSSVTKIFTPIVSVATRVLMPVAGVAASLFTGGAAGGLPGLLQGGLQAFTGGGGILGRIAAVAGQRMTGGGMLSAFGGDQGGGIFGGASGPPLGGFDTAPGMVAPSGDYSNPNQMSPVTAGALSSPANFGQQSQLGGLFSGLGSGINSFLADKQQRDLINAQIASRERMQDKELQYLTDKEQRLRDSYHVGDSALHPKKPRNWNGPQDGVAYN